MSLDSHAQDKHALFMVASLAGAPNAKLLAADAAKHLLELASTKQPQDAVSHLASAALAFTVAGDKPNAAHALQRIAAAATGELKEHAQKAHKGLQAQAPPPPPSVPAPKPVNAPKAEAPKAEPPKPAPAPAPPAPPKAAETVKAPEPPQAEPPKPTSLL